MSRWRSPSSRARFTERGLRPRLRGEPAEWHHDLAPSTPAVNPTAPAPAPPVPATHLPEGLRVEEAIRIAEAIGATHAESTRSYRVTWGQWERWCRARGVVPMPAPPAMICAYLTDRAGEGISVDTVGMACGAIS